MKHICPHCGEKSFSPLRKAMCGGMSSNGKVCMSCGKRCVNGKASLAVNSVLRGIALIMILVVYFIHTNLTQVLWFGVVPFVLAYIIGFVFDMFVGKLIPAIKRQ